MSEQRKMFFQSPKKSFPPKFSKYHADVILLISKKFLTEVSNNTGCPSKCDGSYLLGWNYEQDWCS